MEQSKIAIPRRAPSWRQPPPAPSYKGEVMAGYGVIIRNDKGEVMAASSARGDSASGSEEAEVLACHHADEFALGF